MINFIQNYKKEKDIEKEYIYKFEIKKNENADNISGKINPKDICQGKEINILQNTDVIEKFKSQDKEDNFNFIFDKNIENDKLYSNYRITQKTGRLIGPCICSECSGINDKDVKLY